MWHLDKHASLLLVRGLDNQIVVFVQSLAIRSHRPGSRIIRKAAGLDQISREDGVARFSKCGFESPSQEILISILERPSYLQ